jgi:hypothetical protein
VACTAQTPHVTQAARTRHKSAAMGRVADADSEILAHSKTSKGFIMQRRMTAAPVSKTSVRSDPGLRAASESLAVLVEVVQ